MYRPAGTIGACTTIGRMSLVRVGQTQDLSRVCSVGVRAKGRTLIGPKARSVVPACASRLAASPSNPRTPLASLGGGSARGVLVAGVLRDAYGHVVDELRDLGNGQVGPVRRARPDWRRRAAATPPWTRPSPTWRLCHQAGGTPRYTPRGCWGAGTGPARSAGEHQALSKLGRDRLADTRGGVRDQRRSNACLGRGSAWPCRAEILARAA
jgi:hypothetical protein